MPHRRIDFAAAHSASHRPPSCTARLPQPHGIGPMLPPTHPPHRRYLTSLLPPEPFEHWYNIHEYAPLFIFFATYLGIVRNKKIPHVARYHVMMVGARRVCGV